MRIARNVPGSPFRTAASGGAGPSGLLFKADWGGTTALDAAPLNSGTPATNYFWQIQGGDNGFTWPPVGVGNANGIGNADVSSLHPIANSTIYWDSTTSTLRSASGPSAGTMVWSANITPRARYDNAFGTQNVLHIQTQTTFDGVSQLPFEIHPTVDVTTLYCQVDIELGSNWTTNFVTNDFMEIMSWKTMDYLTPPPGYRLANYVYRDAGGFYWHSQGDCDPASTQYFFQHNTNTQSYLPAVPVGTPFRMGWAYHKTADNTCWMWLKINGQRAYIQVGQGVADIDRNSTNHNPTGFIYPGDTPPNSNIDRIFLWNLYTNAARSSGTPLDMYIGHIEIWSTPPAY